ncbi:MAG: ATP-binding protein [Thermoplasmata archaeon]|nr:ATP-binding protein [Thermoplasmata archaeon]
MLLITGRPGSGKTSLLTALAQVVQGPRLFVAYRPEEASSPDSGDSMASKPSISLLLVDPEPGEPGAVNPGETVLTDLGPAAPVLPSTAGPTPPEILAAIRKMVAQGGGTLFVDSWDRSTEQAFIEGHDQARVQQLQGSLGGMREWLSSIPVHAAIALLEDPDPQLQSLADAVVHLGWEEEEGGRLRVASVPKLKGRPLADSRFLFTLVGGRFQCPPLPRPGFRAPVGPPDPDPELGAASLWPGSAAFARAFGRLATHSLTGFELAPEMPHRVVEALAFPFAAHVLRSGGRVLWIPSPQSPPSTLLGELSRFVPPDWVRERLRILSAAGSDKALTDLREVVLPIRMSATEGKEPRPATAAPVGPAFPEAHRFLRDTGEGKPSLFLLSFDGLLAVASVGGLTYRPSEFPLIMGAYVRLPNFHGVGFGRSDEPLTVAALPSTDTHLKLRLRHGQIVLFGARPKTNAHLLYWTDPEGRYSLLPIT